MKSSEGFSVLIVGCGELGSRHLQAVASLPEVGCIEVVDPRAVSLDLGRRRLNELVDLEIAPKVRWLSSITEASKYGDLCIVSTQAEGRCRLVRDISESLGYKAFLLEKIIGQSTEEIKSLTNFAKEYGLSVWVNCQSRSYAFHRYVKGKLCLGDPVNISVVGSNLGLATNGIHQADLFSFYDGGNQISKTGASIDPVLRPSKRKEGIYDLTGTLTGSTKNGSHLVISYGHSSTNVIYEHISISTRTYRCIVDNLQKWAMESESRTGWAWFPVSFNPEVLVSQSTKRFASDILKSNHCLLPSLEDSFVAHEFILNALMPNFEQLTGKMLEFCPVT